MTDTQTDNQAAASPINIMAQYVRDLSFENPNTPDSLRADAAPPEMDINIGMDARKIEDDELANLYEVVLNLSARALRNDDIVFIAEMQYGVTVQLNGIPEENHHPVLLIEVPSLIFPFARQIMSNLTMQGGYPPLMLNPIDFRAMYMERFADEIAQAEKEAQEGEGAKPSKKIKPKKETTP